MTAPTEAAVAAGVRATIAAYTAAQDAGATDDLVALYTPDGVLEVTGMPAVRGHDDLRTTLARWAPRGPQQHVVANIVVTRQGPADAHATADVVLFAPGEQGTWGPRIVGRYEDDLALHEGSWRFRRRRSIF